MTTFVLDPSVHVVSSVPRLTKTFPKRQYKDRQFKGTEADWKKKLDQSTTVYVGNLSCYTNEYQLYELFSRCGSIKRIIMGLDKNKKTPCGFCFVEFDERDSAMKSINFLNRTRLDGREIGVDIDAGFEEGRQYGRGAHGGQISDERRREREQGALGGMGGNRGGHQGGPPILTRSITIVACIALISVLMIACQPVISLPEVRHGMTPHMPHRTRYLSPSYIKRFQLGNNETRQSFEKAFAQLLVNIMKSAKPTLLQEFIKATLADKDLKEKAIALFFNNTNTNDEE